MSFPSELKRLPRWVVWRKEPNEDGGKPRKKPYNPVMSKKPAKPNDPSTWGTYEQAMQTQDMFSFSGVGFMFVKEDGYVGVDIDHCYDPETGVFNEVARAVMGRQPTYMEYSPSKTGIHLLFKGKKPEGACKNQELGIEMYDSARYFTVTEDQIPGTPDTVSVDNGALAWIHETYVKPTGKKDSEKKRKPKRKAGEPLTDEEVMEKAQSASDKGLFNDLYDGKWEGKYGSQSEADMALCMKLAFWTAKDPAQIDRLFRASKLFRAKWDKPHRSDGTTYGQETVQKAVEMTDEVYTPSGGAPVIEFEGRYLRIHGDSVSPLTNFVITPVEMIRSDDETQITCIFTNLKGEKYKMTFMTTDFVSTQRFKALINSKTIGLAYYGGDSDLELLKEYISSMEWKEKTGVKAMGIHEHAGRYVFVSADGAVDARLEPVDDIVQLDKYVSIKSNILSTDGLTAEQFKQMGKVLMGFNEPEKAISIIAWAAGCFLKEHLRKEGIKFPHLFLIGEAGSGKSTTLECIILPIFSTDKVTASTQETQFTLMKEAASSNVVPMPLDEFKPSKMDKVRLNALYNHFRDSYDGHDGLRGRADQSIVSYKLLAPMVVAGEESADEAAIRERSIELLFSKKDVKAMERRMALNRIKANPERMGDLGRALLQDALGLQSAIAAEWHKEAMALFDTELPSRVVNNLACCYCGLKLMEKLCISLRLDWDDVFPYPLNQCASLMQEAVYKYLLDGSAHNRSVVEQTFEVVARMGLNPKADYAFSEDGRMLFIRMRDIYDRYTKYRREYAVAGEVLPFDQFMLQLKNSDVYLKSNAQKKFGRENRRCDMIDFELLSSRCDVTGFITDDAVPLV